MDYNARLRQLFFALTRAGELSPGAGRVLEGSAEDRSLGIWIRFQVQLQGASIQSVRYRAFGCPHTLAAAETVAGMLEQQSVDALAALDLPAIAQEVGLPREKFGKLLRLEDALAACHAQAARENQGGVTNGNIDNT